MRAGSSSAQTWQAIQFIRTEEVYIRVPKTSAACRPECFSASRKSGKLPNNLESFRRVWKVSWQSGMFLENLESFHRVRKVVKWVWKVSSQSGKFPDSVESFQTVWKVSSRMKSFRTVLNMSFFRLRTKHLRRLLMLCLSCDAQQLGRMELWHCTRSCITLREIVWPDERLCDSKGGYKTIDEVLTLKGKKLAVLNHSPPPPFIGTFGTFLVTFRQKKSVLQGQKHTIWEVSPKFYQLFTPSQNLWYD